MTIEVHRTDDGVDLQLRIAASSSTPDGIAAELHFNGDGAASVSVDRFLTPDEARELASMLTEMADAAGSTEQADE